MRWRREEKSGLVRRLVASRGAKVSLVGVGLLVGAALVAMSPSARRYLRIESM